MLVRCSALAKYQSFIRSFHEFDRILRIFIIKVQVHLRVSQNYVKIMRNVHLHCGVTLSKGRKL
jgi:hypothetical protein